MNDGYPSNTPVTRAGLLARLTGAATLAAGALLYGNGTSQLATLAPGTAGQVLVSAGAGAPVWTNIYGQVNTWTATQIIKQSGDTSNPGFRIQRLANDSVLQVGYRSGSDTWEYSATFGSTGAYKPITWLTSDVERMRLDINGNLGIGVTPTQKLDVSLGNTGANPAISGTTQVGGMARFRHGNAVLDIGGYAAGQAWLQSCDAGNLAINYDLVFQPNGANVGIGVTPASGAKLQLGTGQSNGIGFQSSGVVDTYLYRDAANSIVTDGYLRSKGAANGIGYADGAGGTVVQATSKSTGVTLNKVTGFITLNAASLAANTAVSFTLTNSAIGVYDAIFVTHNSNGTQGSYTLTATPGAGAATITIRNVTAGALAEGFDIRFFVLKSTNI